MLTLQFTQNSEMFKFVANDSKIEFESNFEGIKLVLNNSNNLTHKIIAKQVSCPKELQNSFTLNIFVCGSDKSVTQCIIYNELFFLITFGDGVPR